MSKRILFVDDEPEWRLVPGTALREAGYEMIIAKDVFETGLWGGPGCVRRRLVAGGRHRLVAGVRCCSPPVVQGRHY